MHNVNVYVYVYLFLELCHKIANMLLIFKKTYLSLAKSMVNIDIKNIFFI